MTKGNSPSASTCVCLYEPDKLPPSSMIPEYVTRSPPKFTIIDASNKMALGIDTGYDCTVDAIDVATQNPTTLLVWNSDFHMTVNLSVLLVPKRFSLLIVQKDQ